MRCWVFDLDDTLYSEIEYLKSAYREIASFFHRPDSLYSEMLSMYYKGNDVFGFVADLLNVDNTKYSKEELLYVYRNHVPKIHLSTGVKEWIRFLKLKGDYIVILTDGRSITQRNKIRSLGLEEVLDKVVISEEIGSEKPSINNYRCIQDSYPECKEYIYVGDNLKKDFITPNRLGWRTIGIRDNGNNIHTQDIVLPSDYYPLTWISSLMELFQLV